MTGWSRRLGAVVAFVGLFGVSLPTGQAQTSVSQGEWRSYGADNASTKYSPLDQITASNFDQLRIAWSWDTADVRILAAHRNDARLRGAGFKATPLMVGGVLFVSTGMVGGVLFVIQGHPPDGRRGAVRQHRVGADRGARRHDGPHSLGLRSRELYRWPPPPT